MQGTNIEAQIRERINRSKMETTTHWGFHTLLLERGGKYIGGFIFDVLIFGRPVV